MKRLMSNTVVVITALCMFAVVLFTCYGSKVEASKYRGTITIGSVVDFSGPVAVADTQIWQGRQDYFRYLNEKKGGILGYEIKEKAIDGKLDIKITLPAFERLASELRTKFVYSAAAVAFAAINKKANDFKCPLMAASANPAFVILSDADKAAGKENYSFSHNPLISSRMWCELEVIKTLWKGDKPPKIGGVFIDNAMGHAEHIMAEYLGQQLGLPLAVTVWQNLTATDALPQVTALKKAEVDFIACGKTTEPSLTVLMREMERQHLKAKLLCGDQILGVAYRNSGFAPAFEGHYEIRYTASGEEVNVPEIKKMREIIARWYPDPKKAEKHFRAYSITGWHSGMIIEEMLRLAIQKYGVDKLTGPNIKAALESIRNFDTNGLSGPINYYPENHEGSSSARFFETKGGKMIPICDWLVPPALTKKLRDPDFYFK